MNEAIAMLKVRCPAPELWDRTGSLPSCQRKVERKGLTLSLLDQQSYHHLRSISCSPVSIHFIPTPRLME
jgi:hypothetical protein